MAVLVVIAVGAGVLAATSHPRVYGPSWGRFTVSFGGPVYGSHATDGFFAYGNHRVGWVAYAPLTNSIAPTDVEAVTVENEVPLVFSPSSLQQMALTNRAAFFARDATENIQNTNGLWVATIGPQCPNGQCRAILLVSNWRALWDVFVALSGPNAKSRVESFVASFGPVG